jgi:endonuclease YncB( thermonuclease family)
MRSALSLLGVLAMVALLHGCVAPVPDVVIGAPGPGGVRFGVHLWTWPHCLTNCFVVRGQGLDSRAVRGGIRDRYLTIKLVRPFTFREESSIALLGVRLIPLTYLQLRGFLDETVLGKRVRWELDPKAAALRGESWDSQLAYVFLPDGTLLNTELIRRGLAVPDPRLEHRLAEQFAAAEQEARASARGVWAPHRVASRPAGAVAEQSCPKVIFAELQLEREDPIGLLGVVPTTISDRVRQEGCEFLHAMTAGQEVRLDLDPAVASSHDRTFGYVDLPDGTHLNAEMIRRGLAHLNRGVMRLPIRRREELLAAEQEARQGQRGLWAENLVLGKEESRRRAQPTPDSACQSLVFTGLETAGLLGVRLQDSLGYLGKESRSFVERLTQGQLVRQEFDPAVGSDDCHLAYVHLPDGTFLNREVLRQGYGRLALPDTEVPLRRADELRAAEREARDQLRGIWQANTVVSGSIAEGFVLMQLKGNSSFVLTGVAVPRRTIKQNRETWGLISRMIGGRPLEIESDRALQDLGDRAGKYARFPDGTTLNEAIVREGLARIDDLNGRSYALRARLEAAEREAKEQGRGIWSAPR